MSLYRIEMDTLGAINIFRLRSGTEPIPEKFVYGLRDGLVFKPKNDFRHSKDPRPLDTWFEGTEDRSLCYTQNSVLIGLIREFKRRFARLQRIARREKCADHTREMNRLLKEVLVVSRAYI